VASHAGFPANYLDSFMRMLVEPERNIEVITYSDLDFRDDFDYENSYRSEWGNWLESMKNGDRDPEKIYVILQHDVDDSPERTHRLLGVQEDLGVRSNVMIFNRPVNRGLLAKTGIVEYNDYPVDMDLFLRLQEKGWLFGYHSNSFEQAAFDFEKSGQFFIEDVEELRSKGLKIEFFCPHGGARDSEGRSNVHFGMPEEMRESVRWVLNRHSIKLNGVRSDGGFRNKERWDNLDLRDFVRSWKPGKRYRLNLHPQHYHDDFLPHEPFMESTWYRELVESAESDFANWWPLPGS
tara:strand:+ start:1152 stop:2030 length:879 start_codon:yes stop_codon:yes gene_type:complete